MSQNDSRTIPEPLPNETGTVHALRACADQGSGIRDQVSSKTIHDRNWSAREAGCAGCRRYRPCRFRPAPRRMDEPLRGGHVGGWA